MTRYYTAEGCIWKFEDGQPPKVRGKHETVWDESTFTNAQDLLDTGDDVTEIEDGEP